MTAALDTNQAKAIGIAAIIGLVVLGLLLGFIITAIVGRLIILIVVLALGAFVWTQRASIEDHIKKCKTDVSFFGVHLELSKSAREKCQHLTNP